MSKEATVNISLRDYKILEKYKDIVERIRSDSGIVATYHNSYTYVLNSDNFIKFDEAIKRIKAENEHRITEARDLASRADAISRDYQARLSRIRESRADALSRLKKKDNQLKWVTIVLGAIMAILSFFLTL